MYRFIFKRFFDILFSLTSLILLFPILIIIGILVKLDSKGPILFEQYRLGKKCVKFKIYKFRTMIYTHRVVDSEVFKGNKDVTRIGYILRRFKLDEIPQLICVLKGDMSLIGPRPCMPDLLNKFNDDAYFRLEVRPGLTGLAQVHGNIHLTWEQRWALDKFYYKNLSFLLDLRIFFKTFLVVFLGEDKFVSR